MMIKRLIPLLLLACGPAWAQGYLADVEHSATSVLLPPICLRATDDTPAGSTLKSGIAATETGLQVSEKSDNEATWTDYPVANINAKSSAIGTWETPDTGDIHWGEAESEGCYQIDFPDTTWSNSGAKYVTIKISDSASPTFADTVVTVNLNATALDTLVDAVFDEPCAGHTTSDTTGNQVCDQAATDTTNIRNDIGGLSDGSNPVWVAGQTLITGTADSGTTTTLVDSTLTSSSTDYLAQGLEINFNGGNADKQSRCITGFTPATDTITFAPAVTGGIGADDAYTITSNAACGLLDQAIEDQGDGYDARDILSILLSEAAGTCVYNSTTRVWTCKDPGNNEVRLVITMGSELDGDRDSVTLTPATP